MDMASISKNSTPVEDPPTSSPLNTFCPILVGVAGGSASGKTTLCNRIISALSESNCRIISFDSFYKTPPPGTHIPDYNFDDPKALDYDLCYQVITKLLMRQPAEIPTYCFQTHRRLDQWTTVEPSDLILLEGILAFHDPRLTAWMNLKIFVSCDDDIRLYRRVLRDIRERGREVSGVIFQYNRFVKPSYDQFIKPSAKYADIIVPGSHDNSVAINFIVQNLKNNLQRIVELRASMRENLYHVDLLDTCWLNINQNKADEKKLNLFMSDKILFLRDQQARTECVNLFKLFSKEGGFKKDLFRVVTLRMVTYALKMMKRHARAASEEFSFLHLFDQNMELPPNIKNVKFLGLIVHFLYEDTHPKLEKIIEKIICENRDIRIYILTPFSNIETMTEITEQKGRNILACNIMCIVQMKDLLRLLNDRCKDKSYCFEGDESFIEQLYEVSYKEIRRKEKSLVV